MQLFPRYVCIRQKLVMSSVKQENDTDLKILITRMNCNGNLQRGLLAQLLN